MTDLETLRVRVAELCGYVSGPHPHYLDRRVWRKGKWSGPTVDLPDYTGSLNAMHEAEKLLTDNGRVCYLSRLLDSEGEAEMTWASIAAVMASAEQRARAFVAVMSA